MSLIFKSSEKTDSGNIVSLPPETESSKISVSTGDYIVSYTTLETGNTNKKFLTTDIITDDAEETSDVKVLSMSGFNAFEQQIYGIISSSLNNNACSVVYSTTTAPTTDKLYNVLNADGVTTITGTTYIELDDSTFGSLETNEGVAPADTNLFGIPANAPNTDVQLLKILKDGTYKINYSLYCYLSAATDEIFTPHIKMVRGISDGEETPKLVHHFNVLEDLTTPPSATATSQYPSYIVNNSTPISYEEPPMYFYSINGSVTITIPVHSVANQEYLGIFIGFTHDTMTFNEINGGGSPVLYFVTNIEYIGT